MKKFLLLLVCLFTIMGLTSCDKAVGEWKFNELEASVAGISATIKDGEKLGGLVTISGADYNLTLKTDKTLVFGTGDKAKEGTWSVADGVYTLTIDGVDHKAEVVDKELHLQYKILTFEVVIKYVRA